MTRRPGSFRCFLPSAWARVLLGAVAGVLAGLLAGPVALAAPKVTVDEELAAIAIDEAVAGGGDERLIGLARKALDKGMTEAASNRYRPAIDQYRNAWGLARKAVKVQVDDD